MDTFFGDLQLAGLGDLDRLLGLVTRLGLDVLDLLDDIVALEDLAEDDVAAIEPAAGDLLAKAPFKVFSDRFNVRSNNSGDEELGAVGVLSGVGHGENALLGVLELEVLIGKLFAVDCDSSQYTMSHSQETLGKHLLDLPPVPSPLVKSPPWIINCLITRWKVDPS